MVGAWLSEVGQAKLLALIHHNQLLKPLDLGEYLFREALALPQLPQHLRCNRLQMEELQLREVVALLPCHHQMSTQ